MIALLKEENTQYPYVNIVCLSRLSEACTVVVALAVSNKSRTLRITYAVQGLDRAISSLVRIVMGRHIAQPKAPNKRYALVASTLHSVLSVTCNRPPVNMLSLGRLGAPGCLFAVLYATSPKARTFFAVVSHNGRVEAQ